MNKNIVTSSLNKLLNQLIMLYPDIEKIHITIEMSCRINRMNAATLMHTLYKSYTEDRQRLIQIWNNMVSSISHSISRTLSRKDIQNLCQLLHSNCTGSSSSLILPKNNYIRLIKSTIMLYDDHPTWEDSDTFMLQLERMPENNEITAFEHNIHILQHTIASIEPSYYPVSMASYGNMQSSYGEIYLSCQTICT